MNRRSVWAVVAGALSAIVITTAVDVLLHVVGVFPPVKEPLTDALAALATAYRVVIGVGSAWLTAWLAPGNPMKHAIVLGSIGAAVALVGVAVTWNLGLGPRWYAIALVALAIPQSWAGARLLEWQSADR